MPKATAAKIRANNKYNAKTYKAFTVNAKIAEYEKISEYCEKNDISKACTVVNSIFAEIYKDSLVLIYRSRIL